MPKYLDTTGNRLHDLELDDMLKRITALETAIAAANAAAAKTATVVKVSTTPTPVPVTTSTPAGGDLGGTYAGPTLNSIGGIGISNALSVAATDGYILVYNSATNTLAWQTAHRSQFVLNSVIKAVTANYSLTLDDSTIYASGVGVTITLLSPGAVATGRLAIIANADAVNTITVAGTLFGGAGSTTIATKTVLAFMDSGTSWFRLWTQAM